MTPNGKPPDKCCVCGKSFRGHEPLMDDDGNVFHQKCAPKVDAEALRERVAEFLESVEKEDADGKPIN